MAYKKKEKNSLLLYYDYKEQFEELNDEQLRKLIYAMIELDKNNKEIELDRMTKMAFIPIKRRLKEDKKKWVETCNQNSENAKKRWGNNQPTVCDGMRMVAKNADKGSDKDKEKDKEKDSEVCVINNTLCDKPPHDLNTIFNFALSLEENYEEKSLKTSCKKFFNWYEEKKWHGVNNWHNKLELWLNDDLEKGKLKLKKEKQVEIIDGIRYENGKRIL